ncbi:MAG: oxidoreductase [Anaerolineaceae bacterium]|nr:oxidoreductase [Anaerolineaceae bacterium]
MNKLKIGVIGCGYWGPNLIRNFIEIPTATMEAVADLDEQRLTHIRTCYPQIPHITRDHRDLFELGLDAVVISTPPQTHFALAKECLQHGLHVLVEKPLTTTSEDARKLIKLAKKQNRLLMVGHTFEYNPAVHALKEMIVSGELGDIHYIDAVRASLGLFHPTLNVIWDLAPHDISILIHLLGQKPTSVSTQGVAYIQKDVEDIAYMTLMFPNNVLSHIRLSWLDPCKTRRITVIGSKKMAVYDDVESHEKIKVYDKRVKAIRRTDTYGEFQFAYHYGSVVSPYIHLQEPLRVECQHFLDCILHDETPLTNGQNGLRVVEIIEAAQQSLKNQGEQVAIADGGLVTLKKNGHRELVNGRPPVTVNNKKSEFINQATQ